MILFSHIFISIFSKTIYSSLLCFNKLCIGFILYVYMYKYKFILRLNMFLNNQNVYIFLVHTWGRHKTYYALLCIVSQNFPKDPPESSKWKSMSYLAKIMDVKVSPWMKFLNNKLCLAEVGCIIRVLWLNDITFWRNTFCFFIR